MNSGELLAIGVMTLAEANKIKGHLAERDVEIFFHHNNQTCASGGCGMQVEVWVKNADIASVREYFAAQYQRNFAGLDINPELLNQVYDPTQAEAICPACGTKFSTQSTACPDCGLVFASP
jgi:ribosomal protein L37E